MELDSQYNNFLKLGPSQFPRVECEKNNDYQKGGTLQHTNTVLFFLYPPLAFRRIQQEKEGIFMDEREMRSETMLPVEERSEAEKMLKLLAEMSQGEMKSYAIFLAGADFAKKLYGIKTV